MASFFEKLKKGMGVEIEETEDVAEETEEKEQEEQEKEEKIEEEKILKKKKVKKIAIEKKKEEKDQEKSFTIQNLTNGQEGQLAVDVFQTETDLIIQSAIAGVKPEDLDISIESDTVSIKGTRKEPFEKEEKNYFYQECYWGPFSREIILPEETDPSRAEATMKEGILIIKIPKIERKKKRKIEVKV